MKKFFKKSLIILIVLLFIISIAGCGKQQEVKETEKPIILKAAHVLSPTSHYEKGMQKFAELVEQKTEGKIKIEVYSGGVLGSERDMIESMQLGTLDIGLVSTAPLGGFLPKMMIFDLPFIFKDSEHAWSTADGPVGKEIFKELESQKIVGLAYWENGFRHLFTREVPVSKPKDLEGLKIRLMENVVHTTSYKVLGAIPVPMAWGELYTALQQGTVDGAENSIPVVYTSKFYEVCNNLTLTGHFYGIAPLLMSKATYDNLPEEYQKIIKDAAVEARDYQRNVTKQMEEDYIKKLKEVGMNIIKVDRSEFREKCKDVYTMFTDKIPEELINKVVK
jgi:tripartite ATP-independent transporter DctP family solute receptor